MTHTSCFFVTGTGTGVGKTFVTRGLAACGRRRGLRVAAVKPYETGCEPDALDAIALARASGHLGLADGQGFYRARAPLSPWAATLGGEAPAPAVGALVVEVRRRVEGAQLALIEGAGGLLVPVDAATDVADLAVALDAPILLVAANALGVLSHTLTAAESARSRGLSIAAVVLTEPTGVANPSKVHNRLILETRLGVPIVVWPHVADDDDALADAADASGLAALLLDEGR